MWKSREAILILAGRDGCGCGRSGLGGSLLERTGGVGFATGSGRSVRTSSPRPWASRKSSSISAMESSSADQSHSSLGDEMDHQPLALHVAAHAEQARAHDDAAMGLEDLGPDHEVGDAVFVLDGDEHHARGGARPLAHQDQPGQ